MDRLPQIILPQIRPIDQQNNQLLGAQQNNQQLPGVQQNNQQHGLPEIPQLLQHNQQMPQLPHQLPSQLPPKLMFGSPQNEQTLPRLPDNYQELHRLPGLPQNYQQLRQLPQSDPHLAQLLTRFFKGNLHQIKSTTNVTKKEISDLLTQDSYYRQMKQWPLLTFDQSVLINNKRQIDEVFNVVCGN